MKSIFIHTKFLIFLSIFLSGCRDIELKDSTIPIIDSYVFTSIEYPELHTSLSNSHPYIFNDGGYIEDLGPIINNAIDFNKLQSDSTTLLVYRHDIDYKLQNTRVKVYKGTDGDIVMNVLYEINKTTDDDEERYLNIICVKIPKISNLDTFSYESAVRLKI